MFSHGFMSFAAIGITVACLLIMGTFTLVAVNADASLKQTWSRRTRFWPLWTTAITRGTGQRPCKSKLEAVDNVALRHLHLPGGGHAVLRQRPVPG